MSLLIVLGSGCKVVKIVDGVQDLKVLLDKPRELNKARVEIVHDIPVLHLYGSPTQMGYQYGALLKDELNILFDILETFFSNKKISSFYAFADSVDQYIPLSVKQELLAMAEASSVDYRVLVAYNVLPKIDCSTLSVWGEATVNGNLIFGRNADYSIRSLNDAAGMLIVRHPENGIPSVSISYLGMIGAFTGMNELGLSYGNMLVYNGRSDEFNYLGLPVQLVLRMAADRSTSAKEMAKFIKGHKHMMPINVMCADSTEAFLVEMDQTDIAVRKGADGVLMATNFFIDSTMTNNPRICHRYRKMQNLVQENYGEMDLTKVKEAMSKARRHGRRNIQCIIFEPEKYKMHVSLNRIPAAKGPFYEIDIKELMAE